MSYSRRPPNNDFVSSILESSSPERVVISDVNILIPSLENPTTTVLANPNNNVTLSSRQDTSSGGIISIDNSGNNILTHNSILRQTNDPGRRYNKKGRHRRGSSDATSLVSFTLNDNNNNINNNSQPTVVDNLGSGRLSRIDKSDSNREERLLFNAKEEEMAQHAMQKAQPMFRYSLIFINFSFIVASLMLLMAGVVARENSAVKLCTHCGEVTMVPIVFGAILWLFSLFGFNWIRQRSILFLLVYVAYLLILTVTLVVVVLIAGVYDANASKTETTISPDDAFLKTWIRQANTTDPTTGYSALCQLQAQFNCSGFVYGCCTPDVCYNSSSPPIWVGEVCPLCPKTSIPAPKRCTKVFYTTLQRNLGGFLVICSFSLLVIICGMLLSGLSRKLNYLLFDVSGEAHNNVINY